MCITGIGHSAVLNVFQQQPLELLVAPDITATAARDGMVGEAKTDHRGEGVLARNDSKPRDQLNPYTRLHTHTRARAPSHCFTLLHTPSHSFTLQRVVHTHT